METFEEIGEGSMENCVTKVDEDESHNSDNQLPKTDLKYWFIKYTRDSVDSYWKKEVKAGKMRRSASIAVMNSSKKDFDNMCEVIKASLDEDDLDFFLRLKSTSNELRNKVWEKQERRHREQMNEELMKCKKNRKAAMSMAVKSVETVDYELAKTNSLTYLWGRLQEAEKNNEELKESIFHKMTDRSLLRLSCRHDAPDIAWQIRSLTSQVTCLQERLQHITEKFQNMSPVPRPILNKDNSTLSTKGPYSSFNTVDIKEKASTSKSGWKHSLSKIFRFKKKAKVFNNKL